ncbi:oligopeptide/dipeptide ABC transporter, ATPase subunit [Geodermatophilus obscurus DSM 43160]|uniref:Oligopeptide/dipeptide ABC transporter, ATPase subunit n=1 Tax=Geodermatophilus obscurus (strain ATCC 25078 / DSM 43160 / JCM 3152 / CCUG 61914 / KCC A-0152 / KCTC 9177 / NBRC 13315 / NRRL B-3577 / G-20) TaxID=526225 RepID=D2S648_GEOOG|nr:oligopeptide/dipeptide ABC transporter, ATPase subunit [Geodermatophilus obscurus DSM 43160]
MLEVDDLSVTFARRGEQPTLAVDGVSFSVSAGETIGLVGESGCGKSVTSLAVMGLLPKRGVQVGGSVRLAGTELLGAPDRTLRRLRGSEMAMVFQDPLSSLNPTVPIGTQVTEVLVEHRDMGKKEAAAEATDLLDRVGIPDPARRLKEYPHQLSGGMRQRALIAMSLACSPRLLIADEPTTALDVTIQAQILELLRELVVDTGTALVMITHDLGVVAGLCDRVHVMYAGKVIETADRHELFARPRQPYTGGLLASVPRLDAGRGVPLTPIRGSARDTIPWAEGCAFAPRCDNAQDDCLTEVAGSTVPLEYDGPGRELRCRHPLTYPEQTPAGATASGAGR